MGDDHRIVNDVVKPNPAKDEILVKVVASALDTAHQPIIDKEIPVAYILHKVKNPLYLGYHYSGTIEAIGSDVVDLQEGDEVYGFLQYESSQTQGAFAEYITVNHKECALKPKGISFEVAAAATTEPITALQAIRDKGGLTLEGKAQKNILVVGAAGGVGSAAVQIAKHLFGAHVTAVCSSRDCKQVKENFGADIVIDRTIEPQYWKRLAKEKVQFDVILDAPCVLPSLATNLLRPNGTIVTTAPTGTMYWNMLKLLFSPKQATWVMCNSNKDDLKSIGNLLSSGDKLMVPVDSTFKIKDMQKAMSKQAGRKNGRVVIQVQNGWN